jgi:hypothetical protein
MMPLNFKPKYIKEGRTFMGAGYLLVSPIENFQSGMNAFETGFENFYPESKVLLRVLFLIGDAATSEDDEPPGGS